MKFIKRLIVMSGENNRGTLSLEKNALGVFVKFNSFGKALNESELTVLTDGKRHYRRIRGDKANFELEEAGDIEVIHAAMFSGDNLIMYGTNDPKRLSKLQIDGLRQKKSVVPSALTGDEKIFSLRKNAADYFLDIKKDGGAGKDKAATTAALSATEEKYCDDAIAETNYYPEVYPDIYPYAANAALSEAAFTAEARLTDYGDTSPSLLGINYLLGKYGFKFSPRISVSQYAGAPDFAVAANSNYNQATNNNLKKRYYAVRKIKKIHNAGVTVAQNTAQSEKSLKPAAKQQKTQAADAVKMAADGFNKTIEKAAEIGKDGYVKARNATFYERCAEDIEKLFKGEREKNLEKLLPGSKWARIDFSAGGKYYVIGLIGKEYLCYGVPADFTPQPPEELKGYCWWFPLDVKNPQGKGYWIMYQNLSTGEAVFP